MASPESSDPREVAIRIKGQESSTKEIELSVSSQPLRLRSNVGTKSCEQGKIVHPTLLRRKSTKSRLMDYSEEQDQPRSRRMFDKSSEFAFIDDDPFLEEDFPKEYKKLKFSPLTIVELLSFLLIVAGFVCTLTIPIFKAKTIFDLELWKWEVMVLVLICGRLVSWLGVKLVVYFIERSFLLRKQVCYFVYGLRNPVQNCIWLSLVLVAWLCIFEKKVDELTNKKVLPYVTKIWICLLVATFIWLLKTLVVKVLAMSFHVNTFFDKIHESLFDQHVIETLLKPPSFESQEDDEKVVMENEVIESNKSPVSKRDELKKEEEDMTIEQLRRLNRKNISSWKMKRMMKVVKHGMVKSTFDEQLRESMRGNDSEMQITSEKQARTVATKIFENVATREPGYICLDDLKDFLREEEAIRTMNLFDGESKYKRISQEAFTNWVVNVHRERRDLALSLDDTKTAVKKLHQILDAVVGIIILVICLTILKVTTRNFYIFLSSQILVVVFMFGNTCKTTFESIIFVFVMHPLDVGDRVEVDGDMMLVEEMNILTTVFLKYDNLKIIYPNSVLSSKPIFNYNRSPPTRDTVDFSIHISTPEDKIDKMKKAIISYVNSKSEYWQENPKLFMKDIEDMNRIKWAFWPRHTINFQNINQRWIRRSILMEELIKIFRKLDIEYRMLPQDVNVRNMPLLSSSTRLPSNWKACA